MIGVDLRGAEIEADLSTPAGRAAAVAAVLERSGGRIDRLVPCAGLNTHVQPMHLIPAVNYFGAVALLDGLLPALAARRSAGGGGDLVELRPDGALPRDPLRAGAARRRRSRARARALESGGNGFLAYAGSKLALAIAVRRRAKAWGAAGVRLNAVAPGPTRTPMLEATLADPVYGRFARQLEIPTGGPAEPDDIAAVIAFLLSPAASFVHGSVLYVDGGMDAALRPDGF